MHVKIRVIIQKSLQKARTISQNLLLLVRIVGAIAIIVIATAVVLTVVVLVVVAVVVTANKNEVNVVIPPRLAPRQHLNLL